MFVTHAKFFCNNRTLRGCPTFKLRQPRFLKYIMNRKIRFGVVGTNFITDWIIAGAREDERFELAAVCSRTIERGTEYAAKHNLYIIGRYGTE